MNDRKDALAATCLVSVFLVSAITGVLAQVCRIGHGPVMPLAIVAPFASLLLLSDWRLLWDWDVLVVWAAILQFPIYAIGLLVASARKVLGKVVFAICLVHGISAGLALVEILRR
jgi:hypothetical protein